MSYLNSTTFLTEAKEGVLTVTFNQPPINIQSNKQLDELDKLAEKLEGDRTIKVVVFQSNVPEFFIAHFDIEVLKDFSTEAVPRDKVELLYLQKVCERISELPQATIAKIEGFARGGGHEFALACDMRFAARDKAIFMQMEVGMGILPCGGGASRMARQCGLGRALEVILSARDFDADEAARIGTVNRAIDADKIGEFVDKLAERISKFPADSITACKRTVYASIDKTIHESLLEEAYQLYQATSKTPGVKRFKAAYESKFQYDLDNQRQFEAKLLDIQEIN
ncbi:MAG: enoyl-CoA hydratase/isomerase family protein [Rikenellaceae bacterium]